MQIRLEEMADLNTVTESDAAPPIFLSLWVAGSLLPNLLEIGGRELCDLEMLGFLSNSVVKLYRLHLHLAEI